MRATIASISVTFDSSIVASCAPSRERTTTSSPIASFRHAEIQVEEARVHGAQIDRHAGAAVAGGRREFARRARIARHAVDHGSSRRLGALAGGNKSRRPAHCKARGGKRALSHFCTLPRRAPLPFGAKIGVSSSVHDSPMTSSLSRPSGRRADELRKVALTRHYTKHAEGSVLVELGDTK